MKQRAGVFVEREIFAMKRLHATAVRSTTVFSKENPLAMLKLMTLMKNCESWSHT